MRSRIAGLLIRAARLIDPEALSHFFDFHTAQTARMAIKSFRQGNLVARGASKGVVADTIAFLEIHRKEAGPSEESNLAQEYIAELENALEQAKDKSKAKYH